MLHAQFITSLPNPSVLLSRNIKDRLELLDQIPLIHGDVAPVELLERVDALSRNQTVEGVLFLEVAPVQRLVGAFDLDRNAGRALFADLHGLVVSLDGCPGVILV
jgi:hypothetical protein